MKRPEDASAPPPVRARATRHRSWLKRGLAIVLALAALAALAFSLLPQPLQVELAPARREDLVVSITAEGVARLRQRYRVLAPVAGELERLSWQEGAQVEAGQSLGRVTSLQRPPLGAQARAVAEAELSASRAAQRRSEAELTGLRASLAQAERELERTRDLHDQAVVSEATAEAARLEAERLRMSVEASRFGKKHLQFQVAAARAQLELGPDSARGTRGIVSPIDGTVLRVLRRDAGPVAAGEPLLELGRLGELEVVVDLLTQDAVRVAEGDPVVVSEWGGEPLPATVQRVAPTAFTRLSSLGIEEQRIEVTVRLSVDGLAKRRLQDGYRVAAAIEVWRGHDVVTVPSSALFRLHTGWAVYRFGDGQAQVQPVAIGQRNGEKTQILEGIEPPDRVVLYPGERLGDGARVAPLED